MILRFTKMHGAGNDFIVIDAGEQDDTFDIDSLGADGRSRLADRYTGIGCDQLLVLSAPRDESADALLRIFNADGREAVQCGNGLRCVALFLSQKHPGKSRWRLDGAAGIVGAIVESDGSVTVDMGRPVHGSDPVACTEPLPLTVGGQTLEPSLISMGNPHAVIFVDAVADAPVATLGPALQAFFTDGVNVEFAQVTGNNQLRLRVWERGVGETQACGTGACAAAVAGMQHGLQPGWVSIDLPGGQLMVKCAGPGESVWLRGPAQRVFEGQIEL
ncbi:MAG: diaminopimelate epimerase [Gammaproteobacteria bacterium]|nr:diaminopimelate epimerase [Gammaproteobacteria bacterium]NNF60190.1 diaminopimelate epimerase [Gammaproteobacteria bacterium]NNM21603.1 diaminopimelate epimerase [Gammaproteobacteria bacterium]